MAYKLNKPFSKKDYNDFMSEYIQNCHQARSYCMTLNETETALYALEPWEKLQGDEVVDNSEQYQQEQFLKAEQAKYAEITEKYDYSNKYLILKVDEEQELYANVAWYQTWSKVISLVQQIAPQSETTTLPSAVRFYKLTPDGKLYNKSISDLDVTKLLEYFNKVQFAQFNVLQPKRDILYLQLTQAKTIKEIKAIEVDFGMTLNEQDMADVNTKLDLSYVEATEEKPNG